MFFFFVYYISFFFAYFCFFFFFIFFFVFFFFFFFQAEDGIRDVAVTGVQTCALPIFSPFPTFSISVFNKFFAYCLNLSLSGVLGKVDSVYSKCFMYSITLFLNSSSVGLKILFTLYHEVAQAVEYIFAKSSINLSISK